MAEMKYVRRSATPFRNCCVGRSEYHAGDLVNRLLICALACAAMSAWASDSPQTRSHKAESVQADCGDSVSTRYRDHRFSVFGQDPALALELEEAFRFVPSSANRLQNGSFELGLGAEPFHPGWAPQGKQKGQSAQPLPSFSPPPPVIDNTQSAVDRSSLMLTIPAGAYRSWLYITPPSDTLKAFCFSARADHGTVQAKVMTKTAAPRTHGKPHVLDSTWKRFRSPIHNITKTSYHLMVELIQIGDSSRPTKVWIDAIQCLETNGVVDIGEAPEVELNFLPESRHGIHWADMPFVLPFAGHSRTNRTIDLAFYAKDVSRPGVIHKPWSSQASFQKGEVFDTTITAEALPRGTYVGLLVARDARTHLVVGVARRYFAVISDLSGVEPPWFSLGSLQGLRNWQNEIEFNWHGGWTPDDHYRLMYQTGLRVHSVEPHWSDLEPQEGRFNWYLDGDMEAAARNGCSHLVVLLGAPAFLKKAEYEDLNPERGYFGMPGWLIPKCNVIPKEGLGGVMTSKKNEDTILVLPNPPKLIEMFTRLVGRWGSDKLGAVLTYAEINLLMNPEYYAKHVLSHVYAPMKAVAPKTKVIFGVSYDFEDKPSSYISRVFAAGGTNFCDGVSSHNYMYPIISSKGISAITGFASRIDHKTSKSGEPLVMGQTAVGGITSHISSKGPNKHFGWDLAQRELIDVGAGARWSCGDSLYMSFWTVGMKNSFSNYRGPLLAPAESAVANNAIYSILAGAKGEGLIELDPNLMIATFKSSEHWFAALACTDKNDAWVRVDTKLADLKNLEVFDLWGEPVPLNASLMVNKEAVFLKTTDSRLFDRLASAKLQWTANAMTVYVQGDYTDPAEMWKMASTGSMDIEFGATVSSFSVLEDADPKRKGTPVARGIINADGSKNPDAGMWSSVESTYKSSCIPLTNPEGAIPKKVYAWSSLYSPSAVSMDLMFSFAHISKAALWVNGVEKESWTLADNHFLGHQWLKQTPHLSAGMNNLLLVLTPEGNGKPIFRMRTWAAELPESVRLTQTPGTDMTLTKLNGPGRLFNPEQMWRASNTKWVGWKEATYNMDFSFRDGNSYPVDRIEIEGVPGSAKLAPKKWAFYGSDNGTDWVLIDSQDSVPWGEGGGRYKVFEFSNPQRYSHYRWHLPPESDGHLLRKIRRIHLCCSRDLVAAQFRMTDRPRSNE